MQQPAQEDLVRIFSDGACSGNPGPGGWAFIMEHPASGKRIERFGAEPMTTNNRMEIISALQGLTMLKRPCRVELVTDSQYLAKGISEWLAGWRSNGYKRREAGKLKPLQNEDLWRLVDEQVSRHQIHVIHVKGHSGHPENERCDQLAVAAYKKLMLEASRAGTSGSWASSQPASVKSDRPRVIDPAPSLEVPEEDYYSGYVPPKETSITEPVYASVKNLSETADENISVPIEPVTVEKVRKSRKTPLKSVSPVTVSAENIEASLEPPERKPRKRKAAPLNQVEATEELSNPSEAEVTPKKRGRKPKASE